MSQILSNAFPSRASPIPSGGSRTAKPHRSASHKRWLIRRGGPDFNELGQVDMFARPLSCELVNVQRFGVALQHARWRERWANLYGRLWRIGARTGRLC